MGASRGKARTAKTGTGKRSRRATPLPAAKRRDQLLEVASQILVEEGIRALTMERLAERAGVSKGLGYAYFDDVEDVTVSLWDREVADIYRRVEDAMIEDLPFEPRVEAAVSVYFDIVGERGVILGILQSYLSRVRMERETGERVVEFLRFWAGQITEAFGPTPVAANAVAAQMLNAVEVSARIWSMGYIGRAEAERLCVDFLLGGLQRSLHGTKTAERRPRAPRRRA